jgi:hypothetical protein
MRRFGDSINPSKAAFFALLYVASVAALSAQAMMQSAPQAEATAAGPAMTAAAPAAAPAPASQSSITGTIGQINGTTVFVTGEDGSVTSIGIAADTLILGRKAATLDSIQPGEALGVAATRADDGSLTATVINVFPPELWQRARKGQFPMANGQVMTNAPVDRLGSGVQGKTLFLKYDMLTAAIAVPDNAEIRRAVTLKLSDLKPGEKVTVRGQSGSDGAFTASSLSLDLPG